VRTQSPSGDSQGSIDELKSPACLQARSQQWERLNSFRPRRPETLRKSGSLARIESFGTTLQGGRQSGSTVALESTGVACRPQHAAPVRSQNSSPGLRDPEHREVKVCHRWESSNRLEESRQHSGERPDEQSWGVAVGTWRRQVAARGYFPARRERGCVHTEHAVARRRPKRSKVVS